MSIHDILLSDVGRMLAGQILGEQGLTGMPLTQVEVGESVTL